MIEKIIYLEAIELVHLYGVNNTKLKKLIQCFPKVKIIARGNELKVIGDVEEILNLEEKLKLLIEHIDKYNFLTDEQFDNLLNVSPNMVISADEEDVLLFGNNGRPIKAITAHQKKLVAEYKANDLIFAMGPAGSGKTYIAVALAVRALKNKEVKRIVLSRPAVEAEEKLGFLPGDLKEKLDPYLQPLYDALGDMIPIRRLEEYMKDGVIQIAPLAFMRGRTLANSFVVLDESQNATNKQMKMFLTRMGNNSKFIITGDATQIDLPHKKMSGLLNIEHTLSGIEGISVIHFDADDIIRHRLVRAIVDAYQREDEQN